MTLRARAVLVCVALCAIAGVRADVRALQNAAGVPLPPGAERAYRALEKRFDRDGAWAIVTHMDRFWRIAGNSGFNASIDDIRNRLAKAGFGVAGSGRVDATLRVDEYPAGSPGWDHSVATVTFEGGDDREPLFSRERDRVALCINSFSTPPDGIVAPLVDVGAAASDADFANKSIRGAIVLGDAPVGRLWQLAVKSRGAAGVISTSIAPYIRPADPAQFTREEQKDVFQWGSVPYDTTARSFGFKSSWRTAQRMRERLRSGAVSLRVRIDSRFYDGPSRSLVAEIRGRSRPNERIVMVAHVQEPGANDNASGCATQYGIARALRAAIESGALPPPERTLTFIWTDEIRGSRQWLTSRPDDSRGVQYMFALDMTGEDTAKTGGTFLIEKQPDPSAVWPRPSDPHTEWGASQVKADALKGSLLNDLHLAVCRRRARDTGWVVRTNPYEGGSDHTVFGAAGVPSLLNWHFTDRYYHTNQDRPDKLSVAEMEHVGISVATSAWFLASAGEKDALAVVELLARAASDRLALERRQGKDAPEVERLVQQAWIRWYQEALDSVVALPMQASDTLRDAVTTAKSRVR